MRNAVVTVLVLAAAAAGCRRNGSTDGASASHHAAALLALNLPPVRGGRPLPKGAPLVWVAGDQVLCDGTAVASTLGIMRASPFERIDGLTDALQRTRDASGADLVVVGFDASAPSTLVKSVLQTAGFAGFRHAALAARGADGAARVLDVTTILPVANAAEPVMSLRVAVHREAWALVWADGSGGGVSASRADGGSFADLYDVVPREVAAHAALNAEAGLVQPGAVLHVADKATYADVAAAIDALLPALPVRLSYVPPEPTVKTGTLVAPDGGAGTGGPGRLSPDAMEALVRENRRALLFCYGRTRQHDGTLAGTVRLRLGIEPDGGVAQIAAEPGSTLSDGALIACVEGHLRRVQLPAPKGGRVDFVVPFTLFPDDASDVSDNHRIGPGL